MERHTKILLPPDNDSAVLLRERTNRLKNNDTNTGYALVGQMPLQRLYANAEFSHSLASKVLFPSSLPTKTRKPRSEVTRLAGAEPGRVQHYTRPPHPAESLVLPKFSLVDEIPARARLEKMPSVLWDEDRTDPEEVLSERHLHTLHITVASGRHTCSILQPCWLSSRGHTGDLTRCAHSQYWSGSNFGVDLWGAEPPLSCVCSEQGRCLI